jgi:hypothetical protein
MLYVMKWLLVILILCAAVVFVPVQGESLWARGTAKWVARELRAGIQWVSHVTPTAKPAPHSPAVSSKAPRDGIVPQPPKEKLKPADQDALKKLIANSR